MSVFPVGLIGPQFVSSPVVASNGSVVDFHDVWRGGRKFICDMAGFAVNVGFLKEVGRECVDTLGRQARIDFLPS